MAKPYTYTVKVTAPNGKTYRIGNGDRLLTLEDGADVRAACIAGALAGAEREIGPGCFVNEADTYAVQYHVASDYQL